MTGVTGDLGAAGASGADAKTDDGGAGGASGGTTAAQAGATSSAGASAGTSPGGSNGEAGGTEQGGAAPQAGAGGSAGTPGTSGAGSGGASAGAAGAAGAPTPPSGACLRSNWTASASASSLSMNPPQLYNPPSQAIDGLTNTRWSSGAPQAGGEWFLLDLGSSAAHVSKITLDASNNATDYPGTYKLEVSNDTSTFTQVASGVGAPVTTISFADQSARYLKVTQTGATVPKWWSIQEITIVCQAN